MYEKEAGNKTEVNSFPSSSGFSSQPLKFFFYWRPSYLKSATQKRYIDEDLNT